MRSIVLGSVLLLAAAPQGSGGVRALWVTRFEYKTAADVRAIVANSAALGFNVLLFQVRGQADAYYRSEIEPWAERLGGADPGFDPLEVACREAQRRGIQLHAWINTLPAWRGKAPPQDRTHIVHRRPEWIVTGRDGRRQGFNDHYVALNPCLPEVRDYTVSVVKDIATRYPIDGLHLDYVRFIEGDWSYDARTLRLFKAASGTTPERDPAAWTAFRRGAVTELVRQVRQALPGGLTLSAAVFPTARSRERVLQEAELWKRKGWIDWVFPMTYEDSAGDFRALADEAAARFGAEGCYPGIGAYKHGTAEQTLRQMDACREGFAVFSYSSFFVSPDETRREDERLCRARREALGRALAPNRR
jgi:uncharacterized lipoprotein YddW (UPF0748 family)